MREQPSVVHRLVALSKQWPAGGGGGQNREQTSPDVEQGSVGEHVSPVHCLVSMSKQCPVTGGGGGGHWSVHI